MDENDGDFPLKIGVKELLTMGSCAEADRAKNRMLTGTSAGTEERRLKRAEATKAEPQELQELTPEARERHVTSLYSLLCLLFFYIRST